LPFAIITFVAGTVSFFLQSMGSFVGFGGLLVFQGGGLVVVGAAGATDFVPVFSRTISLFWRPSFSSLVGLE
jgi:hypothetical protein